MLHLRSCCLQVLLTLLVPSHPSPPPHSAANPSQSPVCTQADTDGWWMYQLDLLPYAFRTPAGHSKTGCMGGASLNGGILAAKSSGRLSGDRVSLTVSATAKRVAIAT